MPGEILAKIAKYLDEKTLIKLTKEISKFNQEQAFFSNYDGREVKYDYSEMDEIVLAYATTIHKSQGSEYQAKFQV